MKKKLLGMPAILCLMPVFLLGMTPARAGNPQQGKSYVIEQAENLSRMGSSSWQGLSFANRIGRIDGMESLPMASFPAFRVSASGVPSDFTVVEMDGYAYTSRPGWPRLPLKKERIEIPQGATVRVEIGETAYTDINLADAGCKAPVFPAQLPVSKGAKEAVELRYDAQAYAIDAFLSGDESDNLVEVEETGTMRAARLGYLVVRPFRYNPVTHTLRVYTQVDFRVVFENADQQATLQMKEKYASPAFSGLENQVLNPISFNSAKPGAVALPQTKSEAFQKPVRYVIVSDPMFRDSLQKFVNWKARFGYEVVQAYTDQPEVGKTYESIRAYLKGLYDMATETEPAPSYVLFVGDLAQIPSKKCAGMSWYDEGHYSDLYYCEYTGDFYPEVFYGRMSATSVAELMPQINKTMYMEGLAYERSSFLDTSVVIAGVDSRFQSSHLNPAVEYIHGLYLKDTLARHGYMYLGPESSSRSQDIINNINKGTAVVIYTAHGMSGEWSDPYISNNDVRNKFTNKDKYPLMIGNCCLSGKFDDAVCFGEALLRKENAGASVYIGATNSTYFDEDVYWAIGYTSRLAAGVTYTYENTGLGANDAMYHTHGESFDQWAVSASEIIYVGNMAVEESGSSLKDYYWEVYHVFGDPSYMPYTYRPEVISATYSSELVMGLDLYEVKTWPYARVALSRDGHVYGVATADETGRAGLLVSGILEEGLYDLCISAQNGLPVMDQVRVFAPSDKYAVVKSEMVEDLEQNEVTDWQYGQEYVVNYLVRNIGTKPIGSLSITLRSDDPYVTFIDNAFSLDQTLNAGEEVTIGHDFRLKVSPAIPDNHELVYEVRMVADGDEDSASVSTLRHRVQAPVFVLTGFRIADTASSVFFNEALDNGEQAQAVVAFANRGSASAKNLKLDILSSASYVSLSEGASPVEVGNVVAGKEVEAVFGLQAEEGSSMWAPYELTVLAMSDGRVDTMKVSSYVRPAMETFETGSFTNAEWNVSPDAGWEIDQSKVYRGLFSAASKKGLGDSEEASLSLEVDVPQDDYVSFHYFVSTEKFFTNLGDFLHFYIDDTEMGRWGGLGAEWAYAGFAVPAGKHTLKWTYKKDNTDAEGEDRVWLDDIRLPLGTWIMGTNVRVGEMDPGSLFSLLKASQGELRLAVSASEPCQGRLSLVNAMGQQVKVLDPALRVETGKTVVSYPIPGLRPGLYFCVFESSLCGRQVVKFVLAD